VGAKFYEKKICDLALRTENHKLGEMKLMKMFEDFFLSWQTKSDRAIFDTNVTFATPSAV